jgi:hypothetical protein
MPDTLTYVITNNILIKAPQRMGKWQLKLVGGVLVTLFSRRIYWCCVWWFVHFTNQRSYIPTAYIYNPKLLQALLPFIYITFVKTLFRKHCFIKCVGCNTKVQYWRYVSGYWLTNNVSYAVCRRVYDLLPNSTFLAPIIRWLSPEKPKAETRVLTVTVLFHTLKNIRQKNGIFYMLSHHLSFQDLKVSLPP